MLANNGSRSTAHLVHFLQTYIDKKDYISGKLLHAHILRVGHSSDTFLSNRLIELYYKCRRTNSARQLFDTMTHKNIYSWHAMLAAYCKLGRIEDAHNLFVQMPERNSVSWNCLISALVRNGAENRALGVYRAMNREAFMPTNFTLASVLSASGALGDSVCGSGCHGFCIKVGLDKNIYVGNALLGMYAKCGCVGDAVKAFEDLPEVNEVSFTALMGALVETDRVEEAFYVFRLMHRNGIHIDSISLSSVLGVCARVGSGEWSNELSRNVHGQLIHGLMIKLGHQSDLHLGNSLLDMYAKDEDMESAEMIFDDMPAVSVVSWNIMIGGYGQVYHLRKAIECMQEMQRCGLEVDEVTCINMLAACIRSGDIETGHQIFERMTSPSLSSWNALLSGYSQAGNHKQAVKLFREMQFRSVPADRTTLAIILSTCAGMELLEGGKQVHAASLKDVLDVDVFVASGLISMYTKCNKIEVAKSIFDRIPQLDVGCWNSMITGLSLNSLDMEAFTLFKQMLGNGMYPSQFSYATALSCCANLSSSSQGRQIHAQVLKNELVNDVFVGSALVGMYSKCGDVDEARQFFNTMQCKNTVTWNEMIHGYAQNGRGEEAVSLYENMIRLGERPDGITFIAVLTACSHSGLVDMGIKIFNSMQQKHGVEPLSDHYTCAIDCLGRAARFHEVEVLLDQMSCKDDPIIWEVLLSSCRVHSNVTLGRRAAEELFRLDPCNSSPYLLLANMYSSMGKWDDANYIREMMTEKQVVKDPGHSWLEHKDEMHMQTVKKDEFEAASC